MSGGEQGLVGGVEDLLDGRAGQVQPGQPAQARTLSARPLGAGPPDEPAELRGWSGSGHHVVEHARRGRGPVVDGPDGGDAGEAVAVAVAEPQPEVPVLQRGQRRVETHLGAGAGEHRGVHRQQRPEVG